MWHNDVGSNLGLLGLVLETEAISRRRAYSMTVRDFSFLAPLMAALLSVALLPCVLVYRKASALSVLSGSKRSGKAVANF